jgi:HlyD family secretion protein
MPTRPGPSVLRRFRWALVLALLCAVAAAGWSALWWLGSAVAAQRIVQRDFVQTVVATGRVETPHRVDVGAQITGTVVRVPVAEGQAVKRGDVLVELESTELRAALRQAEVAVAQANARLRQMREVQVPVAQQALRQAQASLANARAQLRRNQDLFNQGFIGEAVLEDSRKAAELADAQVLTARMQVETVLPTGSDHALAEAAVAQAQASSDAARARLRYALVAAVVDGTLLSRNVEVGDVVQPGKVLMTLSPAGRTQLVVEIDEKNLRLLALGQKALASADAYAQQRFNAVVAYINPGVNAQTGAVEVKLDVPAAPPTLKQDMTVSVDIEVARRTMALLAPVLAVRGAQGAPWVLRIEDGRAVRVPVRIGLASGGFVEVLEGLRAGDLVIPAGVPVTEGARVRVAGPEPSG